MAHMSPAYPAAARAAGALDVKGMGRVATGAEAAACEARARNDNPTVVNTAHTGYQTGSAQNFSHLHRFHKTRRCSFFAQGSCTRGSRCTFAHDTEELSTAPDLTKTKMCPMQFSGKCNDPRCRFAHDYEELRGTSGVYKTELCSWWAKGSCKVGTSCRFAHGTEELQLASLPKRVFDMSVPLRYDHDDLVPSADAVTRNQRFSKPSGGCQLSAFGTTQSTRGQTTAHPPRTQRANVLGSIGQAAQWHKQHQSHYEQQQQQQQQLGSAQQTHGLHPRSELLLSSALEMEDTQAARCVPGMTGQHQHEMCMLSLPVNLPEGQQTSNPQQGCAAEEVIDLSLEDVDCPGVYDFKCNKTICQCGLLCSARHTRIRRTFVEVLDSEEQLIPLQGRLRRSSSDSCLLCAELALCSNLTERKWDSPGEGETTCSEHSLSLESGGTAKCSSTVTAASCIGSLTEGLQQ